MEMEMLQTGAAHVQFTWTLGIWIRVRGNQACNAKAWNFAHPSCSCLDESPWAGQALYGAGVYSTLGREVDVALLSQGGWDAGTAEES